MSVLNITFRKDMSEDETLWGGKTWTNKCCKLRQV